MKKNHSRIILLVTVFLIIASLIIFIDNVNTKKEFEVNSSYYTGFVARVQRLDETLSQTNETKSNGDVVHMLDVYTSIILVNDQLTLLKENTKGFPDIDILINDFSIFRNEYGYLVKNQLEGHHVDPEIHLKVVTQIQLFLNNLPEEYENSREFTDQFNAATVHIKPLLHLNF
ncbi:hypothetical protein [Paenibacillus solani]|uniref:hypothetical protein n=1 Tax=Paenibacillus solani TaxID=1705565 RepID=UPI003D2E59D1